jgi:hypothetical protein
MAYTACRGADVMAFFGFATRYRAPSHSWCHAPNGGPRCIALLNFSSCHGEFNEYRRPAVSYTDGWVCIHGETA